MREADSPMVTSCQSALLSVSGARLANYLGLSFLTPVWWQLGVDQLLDETRIRAVMASGGGLAPGPGMMGDELQDIRQHEARIAWLAQQPSSAWSPLEASSGFCPEDRVTIQLVDGHHRLLSTLIRDQQVTAEVIAGHRDSWLALASHLEARWVREPESPIFGLGVLPAPRLGANRFVQVEQAGEAIWVHDIESAATLARLGGQLWTVQEDLMGEGRREVGMREKRTLAEHREAFFGACEDVMGVGRDELRRYLERG